VKNSSINIIRYLLRYKWNTLIPTAPLATNMIQCWNKDATQL